MAKQTRSVRIREDQNEFLSNNELNLSELVRQEIDNERIRQAVGVCAVCGDVVYVDGGSFASYGDSSSGGQKFGLDYGERIDLCDEHQEKFMDAFYAEMDDVEDDKPYPELEYIKEVYDGDVKAYMLEVKAVMDAQPNKDGGYGESLVANREETRGNDLDPYGYKKQLFNGIWAWLNDDDAARNGATDEFDPHEVFENTDAFPNGIWANVP